MEDLKRDLQNVKKVEKKNIQTSVSYLHFHKTPFLMYCIYTLSVINNGGFTLFIFAAVGHVSPASCNVLFGSVLPSQISAVWSSYR